MPEDNAILLGKGETLQYLNLKLANRHGLIAGATGTGKTVSLQVLAEGFSSNGVPVFLADVKGDLSGLSRPGSPHPKVDERVAKIGIENYQQHPVPVVFWDLFGEQGHPIRTTISEMGPLLLARLLDLNDTQEGVLSIVFRVADEQGLLLLDLKDLRSLLTFVGGNAKEFSLQYGNVSTASVGAIQRSLLTLEQQGGEHFFGEPALAIADLMRSDLSGRGIVNILAADQLMQSPKLYATFLLWLLSELFEELPEVGDPEKPKLVFFFDEAHLLFDEAPKALLEKVEQVVRLIRSKGVGVYFITQNPLDVPDSVLGQLGNRVQHALRAFTPRDQKAVKAAASTFRQNPKIDTEQAITQLGVGEALVSTLQDKGVPSIVEQTLICPPASRIGPITPEERAETRAASPVGDRYNQSLDRESAYEILTKRAEETAAEETAENRPEWSARKRNRRRQHVRQAPDGATGRPFWRLQPRAWCAVWAARSAVRSGVRSFAAYWARFRVSRMSTSDWGRNMHQRDRLCMTTIGSIAVFLMLGCTGETAQPASEPIISDQATFRVELLVDGLDTPWGMAFLPGGDMLITERPGRLRLVTSGALNPEPVGGVPDVFARGQGGLLDVAIDPAFADNSLVYLSYAGIDDDGRSSTRVARGRLVGGALVDAEVIFRSNSASSGGVHWGSRLAFDTAGDLYVSVGERGDGDNAQNLERHGGSVLRIKPDGSVPDDNPFVGQNGARPEIYSYGHRNPQGMAVHPETGRIWTQEHGPQGGDEVNLIEAGLNYGWPVVSWGLNYGGEPIGKGLRELDGMAQPVYYWDPSIAPSGMTFYDGDAFPEWQGDLFVGALKFQLIARLEMEGDKIVAEERLLEGQLGRIRDVKTGPDGFLYILTDDTNGALFRLQPS